MATTGAVVAHTIVRLRANQRVCAGNHTANTHRAVAPGYRTRIYHRAAVPGETTHHIIPVTKRDDTKATHTITRLGANQRVGAGNYTADTYSATAPGHRPGVGHCAVIPVATADHVITIGECNNPILSHLITCSRTNQRIGAANHAADTHRTASPGRRPGISHCATIPAVAAHHVIAVGEYGDDVVAHTIVRLRANQRVCAGNHTANTHRAVAPGYRTRVGDGAVSPGIAAHHIIPVTKRDAASVAHAVIHRTADQRVAAGNDAAHPRRAAAPGRCTGFGDGAVVPADAIHHIIAIAGKGGDGAVADAVTCLTSPQG